MCTSCRGVCPCTAYLFVSTFAYVCKAHSLHSESSCTTWQLVIHCHAISSAVQNITLSRKPFGRLCFRKALSNLKAESICWLSRDGNLSLTPSRQFFFSAERTFYLGLSMHRYKGLDYEAVCEHLTHLIFFSIEVAPDGSFAAMDRYHIPSFILLGMFVLLVSPHISDRRVQFLMALRRIELMQACGASQEHHTPRILRLDKNSPRIFFLQTITRPYILALTGRFPLRPQLMQARNASEKHGTKLLICFGGNSRTNGFPRMVSSKATRRKFLDNLTALLDKHGMHGVDYNWEYPQNEKDWQASGFCTVTVKPFDTLPDGVVVRSAFDAFCGL